MTKKPYNTRIDDEILDTFRNKCRNIGIEQSKILEVLMKGFSENKIPIGFNSENNLIIRDEF